MIKNKFIVPVATWIVITLSLYLSIIVKSRTPFAVPLLLAYIGIGLIGFLYSLLLNVLKMPLGSGYSEPKGAPFRASEPSVPRVESQPFRGSRAIDSDEWEPRIPSKRCM